MNGFSPSQAAWGAWATVVEKVEKAKRAQQYEYQKAMEQEAAERSRTGSRLLKWSSNLTEDFSGSENGSSSSSSDASTKVASSRNFKAGCDGSVMTSLLGLRRRIDAPRAQKPWKDIADNTWVFGEPTGSDGPHGA